MMTYFNQIDILLGISIYNIYNEIVKYLLIIIHISKKLNKI